VQLIFVSTKRLIRFFAQSLNKSLSHLFYRGYLTLHI